MPRTVRGYGASHRTCPGSRCACIRKSRRFFDFCGLELHGRESASSMAAIAERLVGTLAARTPKVTFAGFNLNGIWTLLGDDWI